MNAYQQKMQEDVLRRQMEHQKAQRHDVNRLPYHIKQALLGGTAGTLGWAGDTLNLIQQAAPVIPGMGPLRNRQPVLGTDQIGGLLGADTSSPAFQVGSIGAPDPQDFGRFAGLLAPITWHGTPHKFAPTEKNPLGEFDAAHIGKGEGAQAYGHGLYLADVPGTASTYKAAGLPSPRQAVLDASYVLNGEIPIEKVHNINQTKAAMEVIEADSALKEMLQDRGRLGELVETVQSRIKSGHLYKVDLPDEMVPRMLDWDAPLSEQPESVRKAMQPIVDAVMEKYPQATGNESAGTFYKYYGGMIRSDEKVSQMLREAGIPGIKYFDGNSRSAGKGTRNYVIFPGEEKNLKILERK